MNSLSWMIYAAGALGSLSVTLGILGVMSIVFGGVAALIGTIATSKPDMAKAIMMKWWIPAGLLISSALLPSSTTVYMMAASEAGETIVTSPEAKEVFEDLKTIIKSKLKEQRPKP